MRPSRALLAAAAATLLLVAAPVSADELKWLTSFEDAKAQAKKEQKLVLADFMGSDWCVVCHRLHKEVFDTPEFQTWQAKKAVLLELDYPRKKELPADQKKQNDEILEKTQVQSFPTVIFFDGDGTEVARLGYVKGGPAEWLKAAEAALEAAAKKKAQDAQDAAKKAEQAKAGDPVWLESWDKALETAEKERKPILAAFTGSDWCPACQKLKSDVLETKDWKDWAGRSVVLLLVDFPRERVQAQELKDQNKRIEEKLKVDGYPTLLLLDSKGTKLGELAFDAVMNGPAAAIDEAKKVLEAAKK